MPGPARSALVEGPRASAVEIDHVDFSVTVHPEQEWLEDVPVLLDGHPIRPVHVEPDKLWLQSAPPATVTQVSQEVHLATLPEMFRAFGEAWSARWLKHTAVSVDRWQDALTDIDRVLPPARPMSYAPVSAPQWREAVLRKKASSAPGPDGVTRLDLALMPDDLLQFLLDVCEQAERSGSWPMTAMTAIVTALEKLPGAERVGQFRPIAVLSFTYRVWASVRARQILRHLAPLAPEHMYGMMPGKSAQTVWYALQHMLEVAQLRGEALCGVIADLEKAFNHLPRLPVLAYAVHLGVSLPVVRAWTSAVCLLSRRFKVRDCVGPPIGSTTGFPEGDPMSCCAMSLVCLAFHAHQRSRVPDALSVSYVDNWEGVCSTVDSATAVHRAMMDFCAAWDIKLDASKTIFWASQAVHRRQLRQKGCEVVHHIRELGGQLQFTRAPSNNTLVTRLTSMDYLWPKLHASHSPYPAKVRALKVAAWPRGLYGCSICQLGNQYITALRTAALRGLGSSKPGASAPIHLALVEHPQADPGFFLFRSSVVDIRTHLDRLVAGPILDHLASGTATACPGPVGLFLRRIHAVGWTWELGSQTVRDEISSFELWSLAPQELSGRITRAWQKMVARRLCQRAGFDGLQTADFQLTQSSIAQLPSDDKAALRVALNGTFFTQDALKHFDSRLTPECRFCGVCDSLTHRVEHCPFFVEGRLHTGFQARLQHSPMREAQKLHAWGQEPAGLLEYHRYLTGLLPPASILQDLGGLDLFTDGSCLQPRCPQLRLASWAVTCQSLSRPPWILMTGPLPGLFQSAFRAEVYALQMLLRVARACSTPFRVWTDCLGVVRKVRALRNTAVPPAAMASNGDLWYDVWSSLQDIEVDFQICHVPSHEDLEAHEDAVDRWILSGNHFVDKAATWANLARPDSFWDLYDRLTSEVMAQAATQTTVVAFHSWMARKATRSQQQAALREPEAFQVRGNTVLRWQAGTPCRGRSASHYGHWFTDVVASWLPAVSGGEDSDVGWVSWLHLVLDFMMATGLHPPRRKGKSWFDERAGPAQGLYRWDVSVASRSFAQQIRFICREQGIPLQTTETRSRGAALSLQTSCLWVAYPSKRLEIVDGWMIEQLGHRTGGVLQHRHCRVWKLLPRPAYLAELADL